MRPGLIPRLLSETWSHSQTAVREHGLIPRLLSGDKSMICDILWLWSEGRGSLVPRSRGRREKCLYEAKRRTYVPKECKFLEVLPVKVSETVPLTREG